MCLSTEKLHMKFWPEYNTYYGVGYKNLYAGYKPVDVWQEATGRSKKKHCPKKGIELDGGLGNEYPAGFHIFLNIEDAKRYDRGYEDGTSHIFRVDFTDVIGFGQQYAGGADRDCVIARWMYVHKEPASVAPIKRPPAYQDGCLCSICKNYTVYLEKQKVV